MKTTIYTMTHKTFDPPSDPMYQPLQVGSALHADLHYLRDDTGHNISEQNPYFSELTGMYWVWKNDHLTDIVGICHYRRFLLSDQHRLFTKEQIEQTLAKYDIITSNKLALHSNYYDGFAVDHNICDLQVLEAVLKEKDLIAYTLFERAVHDNKTYFGNIMICRKEQYDAYCSWLFDILFEVAKRVDVTAYDGYRKRLFGFLSEFLQMIYIQKNNLRVKECEVAIIGEKFETREVKEKLAQFFREMDVQGAKAYYLKCRQERPDIIMEASDITGELRLCMQVISTCEFEQRLTGGCILNHISDFKELMRFFRRLNMAVEKHREVQTIAECMNYPFVTQPMIEIAKRVVDAK